VHPLLITNTTNISIINEPRLRAERREKIAIEQHRPPRSAPHSLPSPLASEQARDPDSSVDRSVRALFPRCARAKATSPSSPRERVGAGEASGDVSERGAVKRRGQSRRQRQTHHNPSTQLDR
jgi:hypothetical protein